MNPPIKSSIRGVAFVAALLSLCAAQAQTSQTVSGATSGNITTTAPSFSLSVKDSTVGAVQFGYSNWSKTPNTKSTATFTNSAVAGGILDFGCGDTLTVNQTTVTTPTAGAAAIQVGGVYPLSGEISAVVLTNATLTAAGTSVSFVSSGQTSSIQATNSTLTGGLSTNTGSLSVSSNASTLFGSILGNATVDVSLANGSSWTGIGKTRNLIVDATSLWTLTTGLNLPSLYSASNLSLAGTVAFDGVHVGRQLSIGTLTSTNGSVSLHTVFGGDNSVTDSLAITTSATGTTHLSFLNAGGRGGQTQNGIKVVAVAPTATVAPTAFDMPSGPVEVGLYDYSLVQGQDQSWYLHSSVIPAAKLPPQAINLSESVALAGLGSYMESSQIWARGFGSNAHFSPGENIPSKASLSGVQAGADLWARGDWRVGAYAIGGNSNLTSAEGTIKLRTAGAGMYVNRMVQTGWVEFTAQTAHDNQTTHILGDSLQSGGQNTLVAVEAGKAFVAAKGRLFFVPSVQFVYDRATLGQANGSALMADYRADAAVFGKATLRTAYLSGAGSMLWLDVGAKDQFSGVGSADLTLGDTVTTRSDMRGVTGNAQIGGQVLLGNKVTLFGNAGVEYGRLAHGTSLDLGLRRSF